MQARPAPWSRSSSWSKSCLQVDDAVRAEAGDRLTGSRVERDEPVPGRHVEDALLFAVGPVRQAAAGELSRRRLTARALVLAVHPQHFAGRGVERDHRAPRAGGRKQPAVDHQRRRLELEFRPRAEAVGLESPGDFQLAEVVGGDLIERRVARVAEIAAVGGPLDRWSRQTGHARATEIHASAATIINLRDIVGILSTVS